MNEIHAFPELVKSISFLLPAFFLFALLGFSESLKPAEDRRKVEFFEKLYGTKIMGVKPIDEYQDPDTFYSEIAKRVGIPEIVYKAVEEKYGWKKEGKDYFLALMIKGGGRSDDWGVMVTRFPSALKESRGKEETKRLLKDMEMKMVVVGYDGKVSFPKKK